MVPSKQRGRSVMSCQDVETCAGRNQRHSADTPSGGLESRA